ncbi:hypothetical protein K432DRAFT_377463 [Lepidopterella palustris CBS 459.81]|uniref:Uncharacterized protein n=1 Tax=Lepidopterella palustris CBS 459.81 TaxID=1314670 RepID=A0A8E2JKD8_9PEZI|nr:hypothetical protein K432DRAFT_377463 [Lepidopterella palustris CBS 459.81]
MSPNDPTSTPSPSNLVFTLAQTSKSPIKLQVTLRNTHPSSAITVLKWDSPLDPQAPNLGVFRITNAATGEDVDIPRLMVNRLLPPSRDALQDIAAGSEYSTEVVLDKSWMPSDRWTKYKVKVAGRWKAVWAKPVQDIDANELESLGGGNEAMTGEFSSEEIDLVV